MKRNVKLGVVITSATVATVAVTATAIAIPMQNRINELKDSNKVNQALMERGFEKGIAMFDGFNPVKVEEVNMPGVREDSHAFDTLLGKFKELRGNLKSSKTLQEAILIIDQIRESIAKMQEINNKCIAKNNVLKAEQQRINELVSTNSTLGSDDPLYAHKTLPEVFTPEIATKLGFANFEFKDDFDYKYRINGDAVKIIAMQNFRIGDAIYIPLKPTPVEITWGHVTAKMNTIKATQPSQIHKGDASWVNGEDSKYQVEDTDNPGETNIDLRRLPELTVAIAEQFGVMNFEKMAGYTYTYYNDHVFAADSIIACVFKSDGTGHQIQHRIALKK